MKDNHSNKRYSMINMHEVVFGEFSDITLRQKDETGATSSNGELDNLSNEEIKLLYYKMQVQHIELEMQNNQLRLIQEQLVSQRNRYNDLYDLAPIGYCTISDDGVILEANNTLITMLGANRDDLIHLKISNFIFREDQDTYYLCQKNLENPGQSWTCKLRMQCKDGDFFWARLESKEQYNLAGVKENHLIISDISDYIAIRDTLKLNENIMLAQAQKASMGELMSMIAHQWRQPLNNIALLNQDMFVNMELGKLTNDRLYYIHEKIDGILQFLSKTIDDFRNFFSPDQAKECVTVGEVLQHTLTIIGEGYTSTNITIKVENNSSTAIEIHKNSLVQVFLNILGNAKQVLDANFVKPGIISIGINETSEQVIITVSDNGGGIADEIMDKIAQPYFTTKGVGGTGLGLYIAQTVLETYLSGTLQWHNDTQGACFTIALNIR